jgi:hypothetical protein
MAVYILALGMVFWPLFARSHETMGQWGKHGLSEYLYGRKIGSGSPDPINCCLYAGDDGNGKVSLSHTKKPTSAPGIRIPESTGITAASTTRIQVGGLIPALTVFSPRLVGYS